MVASTITILPIYLDCDGGWSDDGVKRLALAGGVSSLEDDTAVHESDGRAVSTNERSDRALQSWQLTWKDHESEDAGFMWKLFRISRNSNGFLFISPHEDDRVAVAQVMRNTVTGLYVGDGSTTTFQLQYAVTIAHDIGSSESSSDYADVNYPLAGTVVAYKNGVSATISGFSQTTGIVTYSTAPAAGVIPTADYERAIPVRFTSQSIARTLLEGSNSEVRSVQIKEIP